MSDDEKWVVVQFSEDPNTNSHSENYRIEIIYSAIDMNTAWKEAQRLKKQQPDNFFGIRTMKD